MLQFVTKDTEKYFLSVRILEKVSILNRLM